MGVNFVPDNQNILFHRTRWRLAVWYGSMMGIVLILSGWGIYNALLYARRLTVTQELKLVANELHETLEPVLQKPGELTPIAAEILPHLCQVNQKCSLRKASNQKITWLSRKYYFRLLDNDRNLIAVAGNEPQKNWQALPNIARKDKQYETVAVVLHTKDFKQWGYLQVGRTAVAYTNYAANLRLILLLSVPGIIGLLLGIGWWLSGLAMKPVRQSYELLQQFTADAAHELRTPLAAIRATVESTLMMPDLTETETKETLATIGRQNVRLSNLVADLLMLCRMDRQSTMSKTSMEAWEKVVLNNLIKDIVEDFSYLAIKSQIELYIKISTAKPLQVMGSYEELYRTLSNLVANALQYTTPQGKIEIELTCRGKYAAIAVKDTGIGIPKTQLDKIFARFYRLEGDRSLHTGGAGLGLSIAAAIARAHKGKIEVESIPQQGSIFTVILPIL